MAFPVRVYPLEADWVWGGGSLRTLSAPKWQWFPPNLRRLTSYTKGCNLLPNPNTSVLWSIPRLLANDFCSTILEYRASVGAALSLARHWIITSIRSTIKGDRRKLRGSLVPMQWRWTSTAGYKPAPELNHWVPYQLLPHSISGSSPWWLAFPQFIGKGFMSGEEK